MSGGDATPLPNRTGNLGRAIAISHDPRLQRVLAADQPDVAVNGDKLSIRTAEQLSAVLPGKKVVGTLTYERER
jgi:hypothetical protein